MNKLRRKSLETINEKLEELKSELEEIKDEEQEAFDNMPESIQDSEKGEASGTAISNIEDAVGDLESVINSVNESAI